MKWRKMLKIISINKLRNIISAMQSPLNKQKINKIILTNIVNKYIKII